MAWRPNAFCRCRQWHTRPHHPRRVAHRAMSAAPLRTAQQCLPSQSSLTRTRTRACPAALENVAQDTTPRAAAQRSGQPAVRTERSPSPPAASAQTPHACPPPQRAALATYAVEQSGRGASAPSALVAALPSDALGAASTSLSKHARDASTAAATRGKSTGSAAPTDRLQLPVRLGTCLHLAGEAPVTFTLQPWRRLKGGVPDTMPPVIAPRSANTRDVTFWTDDHPNADVSAAAGRSQLGGDAQSLPTGMHGGRSPVAPAHQDVQPAARGAQGACMNMLHAFVKCTELIASAALPMQISGRRLASN